VGWKKRDLVTQAYGELALAGYVFDLEPEEIQFAITKMDTMLASWDSKGVRLGYAIGHSPDGGDPDDESGVAVRNVDAVVLNLAVALAASKGKQLAQSTLKGAKDAYDALVAAVVVSQVQQVQWPHGTPRGAGNRRVTREPFLPAADTSPLQQNPDTGNLDFLGS
jgi:hypothetical protein